MAASWKPAGAMKIHEESCNEALGRKEMTFGHIFRSARARQAGGNVGDTVKLVGRGADHYSGIRDEQKNRQRQLLSETGDYPEFLGRVVLLRCRAEYRCLAGDGRSAHEVCLGSLPLPWSAV